MLLGFYTMLPWEEKYTAMAIPSSLHYNILRDAPECSMTDLSMHVGVSHTKRQNEIKLPDQKF